ncbi:MAG: hypothetical protein HZB56_04545 [Deltaproteobacteria bacterium]|nr:hypothetical protein [Deltaproteobacteria bacterium]
MSAQAPAAPAWRPSDLWRTFAGLIVVLGTAAMLLAGLDSVPSWVAGEPRDLRRVKDVEEAERRLKVRLFLPGYFPETIEWPPHSVRVMQGRTGGAALAFDGRTGGHYMLLVQAARTTEVPSRLLPPATVLDESPVWLRGQRVTLRRIVGPDGNVWRELAWTEKERGLVLRSRGTVDEMLKMARTAREEP